MIVPLDRVQLLIAAAVHIIEAVYNAAQQRPGRTEAGIFFSYLSRGIFQGFSVPTDKLHFSIRKYCSVKYPRAVVRVFSSGSEVVRSNH